MIASRRREKLFSPIFAKAVVKCWFPCLTAAASAHNLNTNVWFADSSLSAAPFNCTFLQLAALRRWVLKAAIGNIHLNVYFFKNSKEYLNLLASLSAQFPKLPPQCRAVLSASSWMAQQLVCVWCPAQTGQTGGWTINLRRSICGKESFHSSWWKDNFILAVRGYHSPLVLIFFKGLLSFHSHTAFRNVNLTIVPHYLGKGGGHCSLKDFMLLRAVS